MSGTTITADEIAGLIASHLDNELDEERGVWFGASSASLDTVDVTFGEQRFTITIEEAK